MDPAPPEGSKPPTVRARARMEAESRGYPVSLRHRGSRPLYVRLVQSMDKMALICSDNAPDPFALLRRHARAVPRWDVESPPLPHAHPRIYAETMAQSGNQPHDDGANQWLSTTNGEVYYDPSAVRGAITRGQP
jgi:hypothetical protein